MFIFVEYGFSLMINIPSKLLHLSRHIIICIWTFGPILFHPTSCTFYMLLIEYPNIEKRSIFESIIYTKKMQKKIKE